MPDRVKLDSEPDTSPAEYAYWQAEDGARVEYSLTAFHEIDFQVNEGYRRIPHGGVEIGGLLWGRLHPDRVTVDAFRQIDCEHASGPSFALSERDLEGIKEQLQRAELDEELRHLEPVGWFVAHTRTPLVLTEREVAVFDKFLPGARRITLLVKPERFQATRFGFLLRDERGHVPREVGSQAFILPLPGRAGKGVLNSIPAPTAKPAAAGRQSSEAPEPPGSPSEIFTTRPLPKPAAVEPPPPPVVPATATANSAPVASSPAIDQSPAQPVETTPPPPPTPIPETAAPPLPEQARGIVQEPAPVQTPVIAAQGSGLSATTRLFFLLLFAAVLGCAVGYFAYLQLPSPYISLDARGRSRDLLINWPADQTRGVNYVAIRVDDGPPQLLTDQQKDAGEFTIPMHGENTKVEIIAQHWIRDSRGIVRYLSEPQLKVERIDAQSPPTNTRGATGSRP